jgi:beta-mannosidase
VVQAVVRAADGRTISDIHFPTALSAVPAPGLGLSAELLEARPDADLRVVRISTRYAAQFVALDARGWTPQDAWFHLAPGEVREVELRRSSPGTRPPRGEVRALNAVARAAFH